MPKFYFICITSEQAHSVYIKLLKVIYPELELSLIAKFLTKLL